VETAVIPAREFVYGQRQEGNMPTGINTAQSVNVSLKQNGYVASVAVLI
jgi:hypothetical protein